MPPHITGMRRKTSRKYGRRSEAMKQTQLRKKGHKMSETSRRKIGR
jgi:hypothetical protein